MKKVIFLLSVGLMCMISTSFASTPTQPPLKVMFKLAPPIKTNTVSGLVQLVSTSNVYWLKTGGSINQANPSQGISAHVPLKVNLLQPAIGSSDGGLVTCNNPGGGQLLINHMTGNATIMVWNAGAYLTCTCTGSAC